MKKSSLIEYFSPIELKNPVDEVIRQIKDLISAGTLKPGDRLPSEQTLEKKLRISRGSIRSALKRLETYGILRTVPQSGSYVAGIGIHALDGLLSNVLQLERKEFESILDTRYVLEIYAAGLVANKATDREIRELKIVHKEFCHQVDKRIASFDEDLVFHLKLGEFSRNSILKSLITLLASDVIWFFKEFEKDIGSDRLLERMKMAVSEHGDVLQAIKERDPSKAAECMRAHYRKAKEFREKVMADKNINKTKYVKFS